MFAPSRKARTRRNSGKDTMTQRNSDAIQAIKSRINIADLVRRYVELRPVGSRLVAPCPFHQETKPSFSVNEEQGTFYCFGCQASGDIFDFYGRINGLDFRESLEQLAEEAGVRLEHFTSAPGQTAAHSRKRDMLAIHKIAAAHFAGNLSVGSAHDCRDYIRERGLNREIVEKFQLGWSLDAWQDLRDTLHRSGFRDDTAVECGLLSRNAGGRVYDRFRNRLMFPIFGLSGQVIAFGGRILPALAREDDAKYINSSDSPIYKKGEHLYGLFQARRSIEVEKCAMLTEGYMDVLTLHQFGYTNAVAGLGTALTPEQVKRLSGFCSTVELLYDGDAPGRKAAFKACGMMLARGMSCRVVLFPEKDDIDSLLRSRGKEAFEDLRRQAREGLSFCIATLRAGSPRESVEWARAFLAEIEIPELFHRIASELASGLGLTESELRGAVLERRQNNAKTFSRRSPEPVRKVSRDREIMTFAVRYPQRLEDLRSYGADLALSAPWAYRLWNKLETISADEIFSALDEQEKKFWIRCRSAEAPPLNEKNEKSELYAIQCMLNVLQTSSHTDSVAAALRQGPTDLDTQREYLRALMEARGRQGDQQL